MFAQFQKEKGPGFKFLDKAEDSKTIINDCNFFHFTQVEFFWLLSNLPIKLLMNISIFSFPAET